MGGIANCCSNVDKDENNIVVGGAPEDDRTRIES